MFSRIATLFSLSTSDDGRLDEVELVRQLDAHVDLPRPIPPLPQMPMLCGLRVKARLRTRGLAVEIDARPCDHRISSRDSGGVWWCDDCHAIVEVKTTRVALPRKVA